MIQVPMTSPEGVTLDIAGKYCPERIFVFPTFSVPENIRRWTVTVPEEKTANYTMVTDSFLAANYNSDNIRIAMLPVSFSNPTAARAVGFIAGSPNMAHSGTVMGYGIQASTEGKLSMSTLYKTLHENNVNNRPKVDSGGNLILLGGVCAGTYSIVAWLV